MNKVILTSQVGADGVLKMSIPLKPEDANKTVRVTVEPVDEAEAPATRPTTREEWLKFIEKTAGSITDSSFEWPPQGEYQQRDVFPGSTCWTRRSEVKAVTTKTEQCQAQSCPTERREGQQCPQQLPWKRPRPS